MLSHPALRGDTESTPLQLKLNRLAELIAKLGSAAGLILLKALMIRFFVQLGTNDPPRTASQKGIAFVQILIISVALIVVAVPGGKVSFSAQLSMVAYLSQVFHWLSLWLRL